MDKKSVVAKTVLVAVLAMGNARQAHAERVTFNIKAGSAARTLEEFAAQSHMSILFPSDEVNAQQTHAVNGRLDPRKALEVMLRGTGLRYRFKGSHRVVVNADNASEGGHIGVERSGLETVSISGSSWQWRIQQPLGVTPLRITETDIEDSGAGNLADVIRTLPQVFGGGPTENTHDFGREAQTNSAIGTGVNLRGLGAEATLVLVDGRPLAPGGTVGGFVDIATLPLSIIDHADITASNGSILYGGDAIGGVVDFSLRDYDGVELEGRLGARASESPGERQLHFMWGKHWDTGHLTVAAGVYDRNALWASQRRQATSDMGIPGATDFDTMAANPGTLLYGGRTYAIPHNQNGQGLTYASFAPGTSNESDLFSDTTILPAEQLQSVMAAGESRVSDSWSLFLDALVSRRTVQAQAAGETATLTVPSTNAFYVSPVKDGTGTEQVLFDFQRDLGPLAMKSEIDGGQLTLGADYAGDGSWSARVYAGYAWQKQQARQPNRVDYPVLAGYLSSSDKTYAFNPYVDGLQTNTDVITRIRDEGHFHLRSDIAYSDVTATGPVLTLPAGDLEATAGVEIRRQTFYADATSRAQSSGGDNLQRRIGAAFAEIRLPLLAESQGIPVLHKLGLSAGAREEYYSDVGSVTTEQLGWEADLPRGFAVQGTWSRLFKAPNLADLSEATNVSAIVPVASPPPAAAADRTNVLVLEGNNRSLKPETANNATLGLNFSLPGKPAMKLALTYFHTVFSNLVEPSPTLSLNALSDPVYTPYVVRNVSASDRAALCGQGEFVGIPQDCVTVPVAAVVDLRLQNSAVIKTSGIDLNTRYTFDANIGEITAGMLGTYLLRYSEAATESSPLVNRLNTEHNPINLRLRGSLTWKSGGFRWSGFVNYQNSYRDIESAPPRNVSSWTTVDMTLAYELDNPGVWGLDDITLRLSALNVFNHDPPFLNNWYEKIGYDQENGDLVGRDMSFTIRVRW